jgi:hypothetical protein
MSAFVTRNTIRGRSEQECHAKSVLNRTFWTCYAIRDNEEDGEEKEEDEIEDATKHSGQFHHINVPHFVRDEN